MLRIGSRYAGVARGHPQVLSVSEAAWPRLENRRKREEPRGACRKAGLFRYVHGGGTASVMAPLGTYEVRYAYGRTWYDYDDLFGPDTICQKADTLVTFSISGTQIKGVKLTLYGVENGNLRTTTLRRSEF